MIISQMIKYSIREKDWFRTFGAGCAVAVVVVVVVWGAPDAGAVAASGGGSGCGSVMLYGCVKDVMDGV